MVGVISLRHSVYCIILILDFISIPICCIIICCIVCVVLPLLLQLGINMQQGCSTHLDYHNLKQVRFM